MMTKRIGLLIVSLQLLAFGLFAGYGGDEKKSGAGESCTKSSDCETDLVCVNLVCVGASGDGDSSQGDGDASDGDGNGDSGGDAFDTCKRHLQCTLSKPESEAASLCQSAQDEAEYQDPERQCCLEKDNCEDFISCFMKNGVSPCGGGGDDDSIDGDAGDGDVTDGDATTGGTWYDSSSGLTWQNPPANNSMDWQSAKDYCANLSLDGHSDWRLPTISELRSLIRGCPGTVTGGACGVTDSCLDSSCWSESDCWSCSFSDGPADGCYWPDEMEGPCNWYWSSSPVEDYANYAWYEIGRASCRERV